METEWKQRNRMYQPCQHLLLNSLDKLNTDELNVFKSHLTTGLLLSNHFDPIPEGQLLNADRHDTVDHMVVSYGPEKAAMITLEILLRSGQIYLAVELHSMYNKGLLMSILDQLSMVQFQAFQFDLARTLLPGLLPIPSRRLKNASRQDTVDLMMLRYGPENALEIIQEILRLDPMYIILKDKNIVTQQWPMRRMLSLGTANEGCCTLADSSSSAGVLKRKRVVDTEPAVESPPDLVVEYAILPKCRKGPIPLTEPTLGSEFTPEILNYESQETYRFQCPHAGVFQCSITGLVFGMEREGEVFYRTVPWDLKLLAQYHKRPAGPLFNIDCPQKSVCQLHLPHCQIGSGRSGFLSVAHVTDDGLEFIPPKMKTDTHIMINITGLSAFGNADDENAISPINALALLFYKPPLVNERRSILHVLLLPSNVVIREVQHERRRRNGDKETYIETGSHCELTPKQEYTLSTEPPNAHQIRPRKAKFVALDYQNYISTFQVFLDTIPKEVNLLLKENGGTENIWDQLIWLPAPSPEALLANPPIPQSAPSGQNFIERHKMALETRLGLLEPILMHLQERGVLISQERDEVLSKSTRCLMNRTLLDMVVRKGNEAQDELYRALEETDSYLIRDLENMTS